MSEKLTDSMTTAELAKVLKLKPKTVRIKAQKGLIPWSFKLGRQYRFNPNSIRAWMASTRGEI